MTQQKENRDQLRPRRRPFPCLGAHGEHDGAIQLEQWWQKTLRAPPPRLPKRVEGLLRALDDDQWYAPWQTREAKELCAGQPPQDNNDAARARVQWPRKLRSVRINGKRLKIDDPSRRTAAWELQEAGRIDPRPPWCR
jgi:hypothetical protein